MVPFIIIQVIKQRLSQIGHAHIDIMGRCSFHSPEEVENGFTSVTKNGRELKYKRLGSITISVLLP